VSKNAFQKEETREREERLTGKTKESKWRDNSR